MHTRCAQPGLDSFWLLQQEEKKNGSDASFEFKVSLSDRKKRKEKALSLWKLGTGSWKEIKEFSSLVLTGKHNDWVSPQLKAFFRSISLSACSNSCLTDIHGRQKSIVPSTPVLKGFQSRAQFSSFYGLLSHKAGFLISQVLIQQKNNASRWFYISSLQGHGAPSWESQVLVALPLIL